MKYDTWIDLNPIKETKYDGNMSKLNFHPNAWPTVDELDEFNSYAIQDTIHQILKGEAVFHGWNIPDAESDIKNNSKAHKGIITSDGYHYDPIRYKKQYIPRPKKIKEGPELSIWAKIPWKEIIPEFRKCIRILMKSKKWTKIQAQEFFLPQVMILNKTRE